jgi:hypothetical protein
MIKHQEDLGNRVYECVSQLAVNVSKKDQGRVKKHMRAMVKKKRHEKKERERLYKSLEV